MSARDADRRARLLLVEPQFLLRRTVAAVARDLDLARIDEATGVDAAAALLAAARYDALLIDIDADGGPIALIERLRRGDTACDAALPVAVFTSSCDAALVARLRALDVRRVLLKPFKVRDVIESIAGLLAAAAPAPATATAPVAAV